MGRIATRLLLERLAEPDKAPQDIVLPIELVVRSSCGCAAVERTGQKQPEKTLSGAV
jgi:LacI family transcriptional regulator